jgi:hypothetical protein
MLTVDLLREKITALEAELQKANIFSIQAQATIGAYQSLITELETFNAAKEINQPESV